MKRLFNFGTYSFELKKNASRKNTTKYIVWVVIFGKELLFRVGNYETMWYIRSENFSNWWHNKKTGRTLPF